MEIKEKRVTEIFLAVILVLLLIVMIFLFTSKAVAGRSTSSVSHSYNTNSYNTYYPDSSRYSRPYSKSYSKYSTDRILLYDSTLDKHYYDKDYYLGYKSDWDYEREGRLFGSYMDKYSVYVRNMDYKGGYFTVKFYFEDYYGREKSRSITHYIKPGEEKRFYYKDLDASKYRYYDWDYEIISRTKVPEKRYYTDRYDYHDNIRYIDEYRY